MYCVQIDVVLQWSSGKIDFTCMYGGTEIHWDASELLQLMQLVSLTLMAVFYSDWQGTADPWLFCIMWNLTKTAHLKG